MEEVPDSFVSHPFTTGQARARGISAKMLHGPRFRQLCRGVHIAADAELGAAVLREAAALAMPADARLSHVSRIQAAGLDFGQVAPVHFTIARDLHLARLDQHIVLHRTELMPPTDDVGVTPAAALLQHAASARKIDFCPRMLPYGWSSMSLPQGKHGVRVRRHCAGAFR